MKRVGMMGAFLFGLAGFLLPAAASAQQAYDQYNGQYYTPQPYAYGYNSAPQYGYDSYGRDWRDAHRDHEWREREERRDREWRRHEWREHERWERSQWRDHDDRRY